jgi:hypothetical protein
MSKVSAQAAATPDATLAHRGWVIIERALDASLVARLNADLAHANEVCHDLQARKGLVGITEGTVHHLVGQGESFLELLERLPMECLRTFLEGNVVLNSYGGVLNRRAVAAYVHNVHRDVRTFTRDCKLMVNVLVMLDDFTLENGATYLLSGSHLEPERPTDERFYREAERAVAPAGSLLFFDSRLWHAAGHNQTDAARRALTLTFTPPFMKPQLDYPRLMGYDDGDRFSEQVRQLLGYNARVPSNLDEWYQPPEQRFYRRDQG